MIQYIPEPASAGLILSYKCSAECLHCMYACSPKWRGDWIMEGDLEMILSQLAGKISPSPYGPEYVNLNTGLHFTGGEPFLNFKLLLKAVEIAEEYMIPSTFVETNCFWCTDDFSTREKLILLKEKGLKGIMISVNPFYLEYIPFERTERAVRISNELFGKNMMVYQVNYYKRFKEIGISGRVSYDDYIALEGNNTLKNVEFFITGRAAYKMRSKLEGSFLQYRAESFFGEPCSPTFLRNWHNHIDNYGNYIPGYCGGVSFGDSRDLDRLLQEGINLEEYPILAFLVKEDIQGLFEFAGSFGYNELQSGYFSKCHLCVDMRKHLAGKSDFKELKPDEFYLRLE